MGGQRRLRQSADRCGPRRRHGLAPTRRVPRRPPAEGDARGSAGASARKPQERDRAQGVRHARLSADRGRREGGRRARVGRPYLHLRESTVRLRLEHITQPGNQKTGEFLFNTYRSFGYQPGYQWFEPRNALGGRTANVVATLRGTVNPELVYVVSSHYDSVAAGPGADDDTSGTAALLEAARVLARHPMPATIVFASFTGESRARSAAGSSCGAPRRTRRRSPAR